MIQIDYNRRKCIGCGVCVEEAPKRWRMSTSDGKSVLINGIQKNGLYYASVYADEILTNEKASDNCPANVIKLRFQ
jgi:ferredoxin